MILLCISFLKFCLYFSFPFLWLYLNADSFLRWTRLLKILSWSSVFFPPILSPYYFWWSFKLKIWLCYAPAWNCLKSSHYLSKTSMFPGIACIILYHLNPDAFTLSSNNSNIVHIWVWLWWCKTGFYWGISAFCQEFFKIMNCFRLCARKFALETNVKSVQNVYILRSMSFWNNQNCILGTGDEMQHNDCKPTHLLKFDFVNLIL